MSPNLVDSIVDLRILSILLLTLGVVIRHSTTTHNYFTGSIVTDVYFVYLIPPQNALYG